MANNEINIASYCNAFMLIVFRSCSFVIFYQEKLKNLLDKCLWNSASPPRNT